MSLDCDDRLLVPVLDAFRQLGVSVTTGYELIHDGKLRARKLGTKTMIEGASLRAFVASLPKFKNGSRPRYQRQRARQPEPMEA